MRNLSLDTQTRITYTYVGHKTNSDSYYNYQVGKTYNLRVRKTLFGHIKIEAQRQGQYRKTTVPGSTRKYHNLEEFKAEWVRS